MRTSPVHQDRFIYIFTNLPDHQINYTDGQKEHGSYTVMCIMVSENKAQQVSTMPVAITIPKSLPAVNTRRPARQKHQTQHLHTNATKSTKVSANFN